MKTSEKTNRVPQGTIPTATQLVKLFDFSAEGRRERSDARAMGRIQKAFEKAIRFGKWSNDTILLRGVTYRMIYSVTWVQDFLRENGYEVVQLDTKGMTERQESRALSKPIRLKAK